MKPSTASQVNTKQFFKWHFLLEVRALRILSAFFKRSCSTCKSISRMTVTVSFESNIKLYQCFVFDRHIEWVPHLLYRLCLYEPQYVAFPTMQLNTPGTRNIIYLFIPKGLSLGQSRRIEMLGQWKRLELRSQRKRFETLVNGARICAFKCMQITRKSLI